MSIEAAGLTELQKQFSVEAPRRMRVLSAQTLNRAATRGRTRLVRIVGDDLNLKSSYIQGQVRIATANSEKLESRLIANKRGIRLAEFDAKQITKAKPLPKGQRREKGSKRPRVNAGISVRIKRGGPRQILPRTFLFKGKNGALIAAIRFPSEGVPDRRGGVRKARGKDVIKVRAGRSRLKQRLAVLGFYGPSVDQVYRRNRPQISEELRDYLATELDRRIAAETLGNQAKGLVR